ncbi:MAG: hypothetical protein RIQ79_642 [Verrucomicrobiota bacterium]
MTKARRILFLALVCGAVIATSAVRATPAGAKSDGRRVVDFAELAGFAYTPPPDGAVWPADTLAGIPEAVRKLDGRRVSVSGFMLPVKMEAGRVKEFLILRNLMACCYGVPPAPNEWIVARSRLGVEPVQDTVTNYAGVLRVGARREEGFFIGIYELELE